LQAAVQVVNQTVMHQVVAVLVVIEPHQDLRLRLEQQ
jgi:hypothetical protein